MTARLPPWFSLRLVPLLLPDSANEQAGWWPRGTRDFQMRNHGLGCVALSPAAQHIGSQDSGTQLGNVYILL